MQRAQWPGELCAAHVELAGTLPVHLVGASSKLRIIRSSLRTPPGLLEPGSLLPSRLLEQRSVYSSLLRVTLLVFDTGEQRRSKAPSPTVAPGPS